MRRLPTFWICAFAAVAVAASAFAAVSSAASANQQVRRIVAVVKPFYDSGLAPTDQPKVSVDRAFDALLASSRREDIAAVRDKMLAEPDQVSPIAMMVLAARLYDVGLRDDAVFWFYAARDRHATLVQAVDLKASGLEPLDQGMRMFSALAGYTINGYAYCDHIKQQLLRKRALDWAEKNPYRLIFSEDKVTAKSGNRADDVKRALHVLRLIAEQDRTFMASKVNLEKYYDTRRKNGAEARYCWR